MNTACNARMLFAAALLAFAAATAPDKASATGLGGLSAGHDLRGDAQIEKTGSLRQRLRNKWDEYKTNKNGKKKNNSNKSGNKLKDSLSKYF